MPLRGKIGILPSSSSSHLVKLEDLMCFFFGWDPCWAQKRTPGVHHFDMYNIHLSPYFLRCTLFLKGTYTIDMNIRYARRHFHPFISGHWRDGNSWQSQASENRSTKLQQTSQRAKRGEDGEVLPIQVPCHLPT